MADASSATSQASASPIANEALWRVGERYEIEARTRLRPPIERQRIRELDAIPRLTALREWLTATLRQVSPKSAMAVAIRSVLTRWPAH